MKPSAIPAATYRLQFNRNFTFADAAAVVPYLHMLGITHVYASPFLKARSGSPHGYDIVDHNALNPEIGDEASLESYVEMLHRHGMGQIMDIVPNHMAVGGDDNSWWLDVLENGEASVYATYFDIDWHPVNTALNNKVLLPFLGDHYGTVLEQGELRLSFDPDKGSFGVRYYEHLFPVDPATYPKILSFRFDAAEKRTGHDLSATSRRQRRDGIVSCKQRLADLCRNQPEVHAFVCDNVRHFNGTAGRPESFDPLHRLLDAQAYRLAYWRVASDEINYRRFFDINGLAGIRIENREVFEATHRLVRKLSGSGQVDGLRVDHPDGLSDPCAYYGALQKLTRERAGGTTSGNPFYLLVEKILASYERLPADWPVAGTTGYETAYLLNGLFVYPGSERPLNRLYRRFTGHSTDFDGLLYERKKLIIRSVLSSELTVLANLLAGIARTDRHTRDFTYHGLREALGEVVACFPVYRTYVTAERTSEEDRRYIRWAIAQARKRNPATDALIFEFIHQLLLLSRLDGYRANVRRRVIHFTLRFQQYTAPVMAKGLEDTTFYIFNRLVSLNDVGFDPRAYGISVNAFHHENRQRLADWPHAMVTTSTHDSKRGEDVRTRINVLSEVADEWRRHLGRWLRINRNKRRLVNDERAPSRNDEYLLYQTLVGAWPTDTPDASGLDAFRSRIENFMLKAIREAKVHTSWASPNEEYEEAVRHFVRALLDDTGSNAFLADFMPFQRRVTRFGLFSSLSQTLLKLTIPGVPDTYQGNELWAFNLVDPDNRRPVDYEQRRFALQALVTRCEAGDLPALTRDLLAQIENGEAKLYLTWRTLCLRRQYPELFTHGEYLALVTTGSKADHVCAFARRLADREVVVVAARWFARLSADENRLPLGDAVWEDTVTEVPEGRGERSYRNVLTGERVGIVRHEHKRAFRTAELLAGFPVALLLGEQAAIPRENEA
jgi:(1->4)-alpha-D-glucan 1-alpha-D-glucosylmutase